MGTIRRCRKCGIVIDHRENNPGGLCDTCDEKASPVYWPNGGTYPYETVEQQDKRWKRDLEYLKSYNRSKGISPYFTYNVPAVDPNKNKHTCWKCKHTYPNSYKKAGGWGLCRDCWGEISLFTKGSGLALFGYIAYLIQRHLFHYTTGMFIADYLLALLVGVFLCLVSALSLYVGMILLVVILSFVKWIEGWLRAIYTLLKDAHSIYKQKLHEDAVKRAELANPQRLDGQALDALLTEQHKEKMGWK